MFLLSIAHDQEWSFTSPKLYGGDGSNFTAGVDDIASHQIADISLTGIELRPFRDGNLQFATQEGFGVIHGIDAFQLQNEAAFVGPEFFQLDFAALVVLAESEEAHAGTKAVGMAGVEFHCDLAVSALRF